jgi:hypothetical protein
MTKTLRVPNESRFVRAFALAIDLGDTLGLLMEIGALGSPDLSIVRRTREALVPAYDSVGDKKNWEMPHRWCSASLHGAVGLGSPANGRHLVVVLTERNLKHLGSNRRR